jgi:glutathione peroxidase-family protein
VEHYADQTCLWNTSVRLVDRQGQVVREAKVASEPEALIRFLTQQDLEIARIFLLA